MPSLGVETGFPDWALACAAGVVWPCCDGGALLPSCRAAEVVDQIWVYGNSYESTLVAIVVPDKKVLMAWAKEAGLPGDFDIIAKDPKARHASLPQPALCLCCRPLCAALAVLPLLACCPWLHGCMACSPAVE